MFENIVGEAEFVFSTWTTCGLLRNVTGLNSLESTDGMTLSVPIRQPWLNLLWDKKAVRQEWFSTIFITRFQSQFII